MSIDPKTLSEPVKDDDSGAWVFPEAWDAPARSSFQTMVTELEAEEQRLADARATAKESAASPSAIVSKKREELAQKRAQREQVEKDLAEDAVFAELMVKHGGRIKRVRTVEGSVGLRAMLQVEADASSVRADAMQSELDKLKVYRDATANTVVYPSVEEFKRLMGKYPGLWTDIFKARDELVSGRREDEAKKDAP